MQHLERTRFFLEVAAVENKHAASRKNFVKEPSAERAAVHHVDACGCLITLVKRFGRARAKAFIGPKNVADAKDQHVTAG